MIMDYVNVIKQLEEMGYSIDNEGNLYLYEDIRHHTIHTHKGKSYPTLLKTINRVRYSVYLGKWQAIKKFGERVLEDQIYYLDGDTMNISADNLGLVSVRQAVYTVLTHKVCNKCGRDLPIDLYVFKDKSTGRRAPRCKECDNEDKRASYRRHYEENRASFIGKNKKYTVARRAIIDSLKESCACCGEHDPACLDFHHLRDKEFEIAKGATYYSLDKVQEEIDKCVVLCSNCHRKLHRYGLTLDELKERVNNE